jgi:CubicO group peptidase (beta-lactamase class C family)
MPTIRLSPVSHRVMRPPLAFILALLGASGPLTGQAPPDLSGLWAATLRFGPDIRGPLIIQRTADGWRADIAGFSVPVRIDGQSARPPSPEGRGGQGVRTPERRGGQGVRTPERRGGQGVRFAFALPDGKGSFRNGHWFQAERYATPVRLAPDGPNRWRGTITPLENRLTFYLPVTGQADGTQRTYLRNPERNLGRFVRVSRIEVTGTDVRLIGRAGQRPDTTLAQGRYWNGVISIPLPGGTYDFTKVTDSSSAFYPRGHPAARYHYVPPLRINDGWPVATVESVGISRDAIERFVQLLVDMPMDSLSTVQIHSLLIARHGKLVVEEYFHGYHRDEPHDTRSAAKSWTATLIGAAMQAGVPLRLDTPVYQTMLGSVPGDLDPRKRAMSLEHLLTMTAGFNCDSDDPASADEDQIADQDSIADWFRHTLDVPLISAPGEKIFYCSAEPNVAGGMLAKIAGQPQAVLFERLIARPLQMRTYHLWLNPSGEAYGGGGHRFVPRDFMKLAQLMVNDGRWNGKQIVSREWTRRSTAPLRDLTPTQQYGYLWNSVAYDYNGRKIRAFFAGGNGGQIFMGIPDLDLVIAFTGGNYSDPALFTAQRVFVPRYLLPAVTAP